MASNSSNGSATGTPPATTQALMVLDGRRIEGTLHLDPDKRRFSDAWEALLNTQRSFVPVTNATINSTASPRTEAADFLLVDKKEVRAVGPLGERVDASSGPIRRTELERVPVVLMLEGLRVAGVAHLDPNRGRFSDTWEALQRDRRPFVILTDATATYHDESQTVAMQVMMIGKDEIQAVYPLEVSDGVTPARRLQRESMQARLILDGLQVEGTLHVEQHPVARYARFSDLWEALMRDRRSFLPVTDATMWTGDGGSKLAVAPLLVVEKGDIRAALPVGVSSTTS